MSIAIFQILDQREINEQSYKSIKNEKIVENIQKQDHILLKSI